MVNYLTAVPLGKAHTGLVTGVAATALGYRAYSMSNALVTDFTIPTGIFESTTPGFYHLPTGVVLANGFQGTIRWFQGNLAVASLADELVDLTRWTQPLDVALAFLDQILTGHNVPDSVGAALHAARAYAFGKRVINPTLNTMEIYDIDGVTLLKTLTLAPAGGPVYTQIG